MATGRIIYAMVHNDAFGYPFISRSKTIYSRRRIMGRRAVSPTSLNRVSSLAFRFTDI
jgi:hypothetical protein